MNTGGACKILNPTNSSEKEQSKANECRKVVIMNDPNHLPGSHPRQHPQQQQQPPLFPPPPTPSSQILLPPGWMSVIDPASGRTYYANPTTGQTSWEPPSLSLPPPPPPPPPPPSAVNPQGLTLNTSNDHLQYNPHHYNAPQLNHGSGGGGYHVNAAIQPVTSTSTPTTGSTITASSIASTPINGSLTNSNTNTTISHVSTLKNVGLFIPAVRAIVQSADSSSCEQEQEQVQSTNNGNNNNISLEFSDISTGVIADLAHVQSIYREQQKLEQGGDDDDPENEEEEDRKKYYYEPLKPMDLPIASRAPHIEFGRVDIRLMSLMDALGKL